MAKEKQNTKVEVLESSELAVVAQNHSNLMVEDDSANDNIMKTMDLGSYCSMKPTDRKGQIALYNAISNPDEKLADMLNMTINIVDIAVEIIELVSEKTGQLERAPRIILIDDKGKAYVCVSFGIMNSLRRIFKMIGEPHWDEPVKMKVKQITKDAKRILTLELVA